MAPPMMLNMKQNLKVPPKSPVAVETMEVVESKVAPAVAEAAKDNEEFTFDDDDDFEQLEFTGATTPTAAAVVEPVNTFKPEEIAFATTSSTTAAAAADVDEFDSLLEDDDLDLENFLLTTLPVALSTAQLEPTETKPKPFLAEPKKLKLGRTKRKRPLSTNASADNTFSSSLPSPPKKPAVVIIDDNQLSPVASTLPGGLKTFGNKRSLHTHQCKVHGPLKVTCTKCGKSLSLASYLKHHNNTHTDIESLQESETFWQLVAPAEHYRSRAEAGYFEAYDSDVHEEDNQQTDYSTEPIGSNFVMAQEIFDALSDSLRRSGKTMIDTIKRFFHFLYPQGSTLHS